MDKIESVAIDAFVTGTINAFNMGMQIERERIVTAANNKVCFDLRDKGECDHSVCYGMVELIALIKGEVK
jgi:hypothetical protein